MTPSKRFHKRIFLAGTAVLLLTSGCAHAPLKTEASTSGIRAAEEVGATEVPRAALHLQLAKEELDRANLYSKQGEHEKAESMLGRAEVDAELAVALSREDSEKNDAKAAIERVRALRRNNPAALGATTQNGAPVSP